MSGEHVFARWISDELQLDTELVDFEMRNRAGLQRTWRNRGIDWRLRRVCAECNSGWMSNLEREAKAHLLPMFQRRRTTLSMKSQVLIARWAVKTAIVLQHTHFVPQTVAPEHYEAALRGTILPGTFVWLAAYRGERLAWYSGTSMSMRVPNGRTIEDGNMGTMVVGGLVLQVLLADPSVGESLRPSDTAGVVRIYPTDRSVSWPPNAVFENEGLEPFAWRMTDD